MNNLTPRQVVAELDKYIIGQNAAKKAVAISLRNRWRRLQLAEKLQDEVTPKNIIMIGATGVGKTEVARRLAKLTGSPFIKVEASKFTEVGYVGRDVESMIRDLTETSISLVREEMNNSVSDGLASNVEERLLDLLLPPQSVSLAVNKPVSSKKKVGKANTNSVMVNSSGDETPNVAGTMSATREKLRKMLRAGKLEDSEVDIVVEDSGPHIEVFTNMGLEEVGFNIQDMMKNMMPSKKKSRKVPIKEARSIVEQQERAKMIDFEDVRTTAIKRVEEQGIVFLDEIDKICQSAGIKGDSVSREGVQRDLLPIVEGSTVMTKYGMVKTDHILFIAAGAFSASKPSDLLPELQGRFPIRVELDNLTKDDFIRILKEPENSLTGQYVSLLQQDGVDLKFTDDGIQAVAEMAFEMNQNVENIGARRLHTLMEKTLEDVAYDAPEVVSGKVVVNRKYVSSRLEKLVRDKQSREYIL
ncbi:ATP-dependent protease ATPase subunit ClpY [Deferribacterales bacterium]|nr:ATP-dependent protease ATPase subunit ClpY [Deferribacterales bacterium]